MLPEKWKLEVSIKSRTNSNLQAVLCGCHQMRLLQALVQIKAPLNAYPAAKPVSAQDMFRIQQKISPAFEHLNEYQFDLDCYSEMTVGVFFRRTKMTAFLNHISQFKP